MHVWIETLDGKYKLFPNGSSAIFNAYKPFSGFSQSLWTDPSSVDALLQNAPTETHFVFMSLSKLQILRTIQVKKLQNLFEQRMSTLNFTSSQKQQFRDRLHFGTSSVDGPGDRAIYELLRSWQDPNGLDLVDVVLDGDVASNITIARLDPFYDWVNGTRAIQNKLLPVVDLGDGCNEYCHNCLAGKLALISRDSTFPQCDYYTKLKHAAYANVAGVVVWNSADKPLEAMNCKDSESRGQRLHILATMINHDDGADIKKALHQNRTVQLMFRTEATLGTSFGVDHSGNLQETGLYQYPSLLFSAWQAQWFDYTHRLNRTIETSSKTTKVFPVFDNLSLRPMTGGPGCYGPHPTMCGPWKVLELSKAVLASHPKLELDFALGCGGPRDLDCPPWDHVVQLRVCHIKHGEESCDAADGPELGRWITSFGRRIGRWLTDVSPLLPLLLAVPGTYNQDRSNISRVNFTMYTTPWEGKQGKIPWTTTLNLRLSSTPNMNPASVPRSILAPWSHVTTQRCEANPCTDNSGGVEYIFRWILFNQTYNENFKPYAFSVPKDTHKVELVTVITGHGSDNHNCGEFCATTHHFTLNSGKEYVKNNSLPLTNPNTGCADLVPSGVTPNEYGTWLYGRDGWCNGRKVFPWVVDLTHDVVLDGTNYLHYRGLFNGSNPDPGPPPTWRQAPPVMMIQTFLVFYQSEMAPDESVIV